MSLLNGRETSEEAAKAVAEYQRQRTFHAKKNHLSHGSSCECVLAHLYAANLNHVPIKTDFGLHAMMSGIGKESSNCDD
jgi:hypothetical protein